MIGFPRFMSLLLFLSAVSSYSFSQKRLDTLTLKKIDAFAISVRFQNDYIKLARDLTDKFPDDISKVRAIFKWITYNIAFDYRFVNSEKERKVPDCDGKFNCVEIMRAWEVNYVKKILQTRRATDEGYAKLFNTLCEMAYIQSEIVPGYHKSKPFQIGNKLFANHFWNAVFIDTSWLFLDASCAAGYCVENEETGKLVKFVKDPQDYYFLLPFTRMARTHFPKNDAWAKEYHLSVQHFFNKPHYHSIEILENMSEEQPASGMLYAKKGDTVFFDFRYKKLIKNIQLNSNVYRNPSLWTTVAVSKRKYKTVRDPWAEKKQVYIPFKKEGDHYSFCYVVTDNSLYYLELLIDYKKAMRYKVTNTKAP